MKNQNKFTDITRISGEFEKPLNNGKIISRKNVDEGIEIYFQNRDNNLEKKNKNPDTPVMRKNFKFSSFEELHLIPDHQPELFA